MVSFGFWPEKLNYYYYLLFFTDDVIQNLTKVMNFHVEHAVSVKSELAAEKAKWLEAEKEG